MSSFWYRRWGKRALDASIAAIAVTLLLPVFWGVSIAILTSLGRPVLFRQERPGRNGRPFRLVKFRTMRPPERGEIWFRSDDLRLNRVGRFIRLFSLDELPTFWNVLCGHMSLVGPRPLLLDYLQKYSTEQRRRHQVRPGITGWAQVNGRQAIAFSRRLELDIWYVDNWGPGLDVQILLKTIGNVLLPKGVLPGQKLDDVDDLGLAADVPASFAADGRTASLSPRRTEPQGARDERISAGVGD